MQVYLRSSWLLLLLLVSLLSTTLQGVQGEVEPEGPSESECRPYIEKALKELETGEAGNIITSKDGEDDNRDKDNQSIEKTENEESIEKQSTNEQEDSQQDTNEQEIEDKNTSLEEAQQSEDSIEDEKAQNDSTPENGELTKDESDEVASQETAKKEETDEITSQEAKAEETKEVTSQEQNTEESDEVTSQEQNQTSNEDEVKENITAESAEDTTEQAPESTETTIIETVESNEETTEKDSGEKTDTIENSKETVESVQDDTTADSGETTETTGDETESTEKSDSKEANSGEKPDSVEATPGDNLKSAEDNTATEKLDSFEDTAEKSDSVEDPETKSVEQTKSDNKSSETEKESAEDANSKESASSGEHSEKSAEENNVGSNEPEEENTTDAVKQERNTDETETDSIENKKESSEENESVVEELSVDFEIPAELKARDHVEQLLKLDEEASEAEKITSKVADITLRELKKLYENAIKPLEVVYKYRDLSNRHFSDSDIFAKPLILFMGPWSGGKSSIINYLLNIEYNETALRTGAEPSPAHFNILLHGDEHEIIDGTQLAADFIFSGLQKFGQGLEERLRGVRLPSKLLEKVNIVEIPGILEVRKQVSRVFPFNDACQWFIDRADIIFLVYDPSKLDVGPETEAILDQLKGREHQTRIILNKADEVKPEELMRVQGALIWNISPLMSSAQPPVMYTTSLWSRPFEAWAPTRLLQAQERAFLRDLRSAIDKRIENKIASARRFAVRVRNHAKMVDCYLTTYYNHKSVFGNRKQVADEIIDHPQDYHIYEGLSTLTNISRYDLPDPDVYRDFFKLNPLYEFQQLSATCTYFRGCPINRLDVAIAYDLPELIGKYKRLIETALAEAHQTPVPVS